MIAHEQPMPGIAADFAQDLSARIPVIETARTRLRAPRLTDYPVWDTLFRGPNTEELGGPFTQQEAFADFCATVSLWLLRGHGPWTVEDRSNHAILGFVLLGFEPGDLEPELGYAFLPQARGKGLATEAAAAALDHALNRLKLPTLVSYVAPTNTRSAALARRLGARLDGSFDGAQVWRHAPKGAGS